MPALYDARRTGKPWGRTIRDARYEAIAFHHFSWNRRAFTVRASWGRVGATRMRPVIDDHVACAKPALVDSRLA